ncbi:MAG TPA: DNA topoisomerase (ATP-hydrolyzing) subunit B [Candidatus Aphodoplasma excrementigallinarum]|uniref:DNA gyrase subunit B n=1 Tax=Candidatus Aphodoplasma excrementigallinarum TaxID=2840673 RepID=A0A9D1T0C5_9FIRM|nr:DNA topoisomerase (ATP-hydrolyzing) subunit B [Candidatus Aphodoplasma excrementigallinarum]
MIENNITNNYDENQIQVLEGLEAVRKRPGMYIGSTSIRGLHHLVYEIVDNAIDEALAGFCKNIDVTIDKGNIVTVIDDGRGIPTGIHPKMGISTLEVVFTILHAGGKFGGGGYKVSGGLHGVGSSVVNALSEWLEVEVCNGEEIYYQKYERGKSCAPAKVIGKTDKTGTKVRFKADDQIFETIEYDYDTLLIRLREQAFLNAGVHINFTDLRGEEVVENKMCYEGGIREFVSHINRKKVPIHDNVIYFDAQKNDAYVEIAMQYTDSYNETLVSFANNINTTEGGTHEVGFKTALTRVFNDYARKYNILKEKDQNLTGEDVREGLTAVISVKVVEAQFEGQTKTKLGNSEIRGLVDKAVSDKFAAFLEENPAVAKLILEKSLTASRAREAARKAREATRKSSTLGDSSLLGKLARCSGNDPEKNEIYIVEGDSAGGSAKQGRDRSFQAILPLWGKMLNVEKARIDKVYGNEKLLPIIMSLGTGIGDEFDITKLKYHKIIIMADADVDGSHIRTLLLTFFFRHMRPLVDNGYIYLAQPPLFKVSKGKNLKYVYNDLDLPKVTAEFGGKCDVQRYKGLGEMTATQLWETTMNPATRTMKRVTVDDAVLADEMFTVLMGDNVEPRREFIEKNASLVTNLDI